MGGAFISLLMSKTMAKWFMGVRIIEEGTPDPTLRDLVNMVHNIARNAGMSSMPEVGIYSSPEVNAFATGWSRNHSLVAVSSGLLHRMNSEEIEGVLGHEMAHIANGDMVTMTLLQGVLNTFVVFLSRAAAYFFQTYVLREEKAGGFMYLVFSILFQVVFAILASLVLCWYSRRREFAADMGSARFVGKKKMISALQKLAELTGRIDTRQQSFATMKISDVPKKVSLFATHPRLEQRIQALQQAPIS